MKHSPFRKCPFIHLSCLKLSTISNFLPKTLSPGSCALWKTVLGGFHSSFSLAVFWLTNHTESAIHTISTFLYRLYHPGLSSCWASLRLLDPVHRTELWSCAWQEVWVLVAACWVVTVITAKKNPASLVSSRGIGWLSGALHAISMVIAMTPKKEAQHWEEQVFLMLVKACQCSLAECGTILLMQLSRAFVFPWKCTLTNVRLACGHQTGKDFCYGTPSLT